MVRDFCAPSVLGANVQRPHFNSNEEEPEDVCGANIYIILFFKGNYFSRFSGFRGIQITPKLLEGDQNYNLVW